MLIPAVAPQQVLDGVPQGDLLWLAAILALPLVGFLINGGLALVRPTAKTTVSVVGAGVVLGAFALAALGLPGVLHRSGEEPLIVRFWSWIPVGALQIDMAFTVDHLSSVMLLIVTGVGGLIHLFSIGYMKDDDGYARFFAYLNLFIMFMLVLVLGASFPVMFIGWEGVGLCSYLLIGFWFNDKANADAGKKAFLVNRIGDFGFLVAMFIIFQSLGTLDFGEVLSTAPNVLAVGGPAVTAITLFLFLGCAGKSAQIPLYIWLPDAMAGPTPVSALIHAATMVTAGVYLVARTNVLFAMAPVSSAVVAGIGALTALFAATIGLRQFDIKRVLAYSTVSQLGLMFLGVGTGSITAGMFHLTTHAFFKALLFLGSGSVIHAMHHAYHATHSHDDAQDMRNMGGLATYLPITCVLMGIATLAIAGIPPFSGFFSKDEILTAAFARGAESSMYRLFWAMGVATAALTAFYMARLMVMTFFGDNRTGAREREHLHEAPWIMTGPLIVLGALSAAGGFLNLSAYFNGNRWMEKWLEPVARVGEQLRPLEAPHHQTETILVVLAVVVALGGLVAGWRVTRGQRILPAGEAPPEVGFMKVLYHKYYVDEIYDAVIIRPLMWISSVFFWKKIDQGLVDGAGVNGTARLSRALGWLGSQLQTGQVGVYVVIFLVGVLYVLGMVVQ